MIRYSNLNPNLNPFWNVLEHSRNFQKRFPTDFKIFCVRCSFFARALLFLAKKRNRNILVVRSWKSLHFVQAKIEPYDFLSKPPETITVVVVLCMRSGFLIILTDRGPISAWTMCSDFRELATRIFLFSFSLKIIRSGQSPKMRGKIFFLNRLGNAGDRLQNFNCSRNGRWPETLEQVSIL